MKFKAKYKLLTSTFHPYEHNADGSWCVGVLKRDLQSGGGVYPLEIEETKSFDAENAEEAMNIAKWIGYHMTRVINPHKFDGFAEVYLKDLHNGSSTPLDFKEVHWADSALRKFLRMQGENHMVEVVGLNSDLLYMYDYLTETGQRLREPNYDEMDPEIEFFLKHEYPFLKKELDIDFWPSNMNVVMMPLAEKRLEELASA